jgi:hypothetical protein
MSFTFTITVAPQSFDKQSAEIAHILRVLDLAKNEIGRGQGTITSGTIVGVSPAGVANTSLGSWSYTPGATKP